MKERQTDGGKREEEEEKREGRDSLMGSIEPVITTGLPRFSSMKDKAEAV